MRMLALSGSLRRESYNTSLLRAAAESAPSGVEVVLYDGIDRLPPYDQDADGAVRPAAVAELCAAVAAADGILIATPEYNGSIPGCLKNALDWVSRPLASNPVRNKPVAVIGASTGAFGAVWAQADLRRVLGLMGARVLDRELPVGMAQTRFADGGDLADPEVRADLAAVVEQLAAAVAEREALAA